MNSITTIEAELALLNHFNFLSNTCCLRLSAHNSGIPFEIDFLKISYKTRYALAIEVKVSKADLNKDLQKKMAIRCYFPEDGPLFKKSCESARPGLPSTRKGWIDYYFEKIKNFYYCVPSDLYDHATIILPSWVGIMVMNRHENGEVVISIKRKSSVLNKHRWTKDEEFKILSLGNKKIFNLQNRIMILNNKVKESVISKSK